jgi:hypothetical protein
MGFDRYTPLHFIIDPTPLLTHRGEPVQVVTSTPSARFSDGIAEEPRTRRVFRDLHRAQGNDPSVGRRPRRHRLQTAAPERRRRARKQVSERRAADARPVGGRRRQPQDSQRSVLRRARMSTPNNGRLSGERAPNGITASPRTAPSLSCRTRPTPRPRHLGAADVRECGPSRCLVTSSLAVAGQCSCRPVPGVSRRRQTRARLNHSECSRVIPGEAEREGRDDGNTR